MGPEKSGDIDFSLCKAGVYAQHCGDIFMVKALLKSHPAGKCKSTWLVWTCNQKPSSSMALWGGDGAAVKTWYLSPTMPTLSLAQWELGLQITGALEGKLKTSYVVQQ